MHLSMQCPTTPTSGVYGGMIGLLSRGLVPRDGDRWGVCQASACIEMDNGHSPRKSRLSERGYTGQSGGLAL